MHAARLVRPIRAANRQFSRSLSAATTTTTTRANDAVIPLSNVEAQWEKLTADEQLTVHQQLEELQKRDWKTLSLDEKKAGAYIRFFLALTWLRRGLGIIIIDSASIYAAYYIAFGPHGPRADLHPPGSVPKLILAILVGVSPEVLCTSQAEPSVGPRKTRPVFFSTVLTAVISPPTSKIHDQGMARGFERACSRTESRPHHR
jgi:hypothetical protein